MASALTQMSDESFWDWAYGRYSAEGVADACLHLQDVQGQNVPLLLWACWCSATGRKLDEDTLEAGCDLAKSWAGLTIEPLRMVRRNLKIKAVDIDDAERLALRDHVKALELEAEKILMSGLERLAPPPSAATLPMINELVRVARSWSRVVPRSALIRLAEHLPA